MVVCWLFQSCSWLAAVVENRLPARLPWESYPQSSNNCNDNLLCRCSSRCPPRSRHRSRKRAFAKFFETCLLPTNLSKTSLDELENVEKHLNRENWIGSRFECSARSAFKMAKCHCPTHRPSWKHHDNRCLRRARVPYQKHWKAG